jgi:hypothetical protein
LSLKCINQFWERYPGEGNELLVALAVADWANDNGEGIYPSLAKLARKSRQSESSARRHLKHMLEIGWLLRVNSGSGGRGVTSVYRISPDWLKGASLKGFPDHPDEGSEAAPEAPREPGLEGSTGVKNPSSMVAGYPHENPSKLEPFQEGNTSNSERVSAERVSNRPEKGAIAVTPDPLEPKNSDARAGARGARATRAPEPPKPLDPAADRAWWANSVLQAFVGEIALTLWEFRNKPVAALPQRLRVSIEQAAPEIIDRYVGGQRSNDAVGRMVSECQDSAKRILAWYQEGQAAA